MKKYFIILTVAALTASAACTKVEVIDNTPGQKISFTAANYAPQTKAGEVSVLNDFTAFKCKAFMHAEGVEIVNDVLSSTSFQNFFGADGETITYHAGTTGTWTPSHDYYWPKGSKSFINFVGWYGTDGIDAVNPTIAYAYTGGKWTATMTWTFTTTLGSAGSNLLYADMAWRFKENNSPATYGVSTNVSEGVPMLFHHALAQINVKAYALNADGKPALTDVVTDGVATWTIKFKNAKITPIYSGGTLTLTNADPGTEKTSQAWTGDWAGTGTAGDVAVSEHTVAAITKATAANVIAPSCVLPQTLGDAAITFDMEIVTSYSNDVSNTEIIPVSIKFSDMGTTAWQQNHKYTYYIKVIPSQNTVLFDPALEAEWIEDTTTTEKEI